jgi:DNA (cytosine-5)-methyltransferase 1
MEAEGYAIGHAVLGAHSVGAPHIRQRLYFVAESNNAERRADVAGRDVINRTSARWQQGDGDAGERGGAAVVADTTGERCGEARGSCERSSQWDGERSTHSSDLGNSSGKGLEGRHLHAERARELIAGAPSLDAWRGEWRTGSDGKARLIESGLEPLAHGVSARVVRLRGYGNAICPQTAAAFIRAYLETQQGEMRAAA